MSDSDKQIGDCKHHKPRGRCPECFIPVAADEAASAFDRQVSGNHYKDMAIQPVQFFHANGIPYIEAACIKYLCRHRAKGKAEDIRKVIHFCELLLELEYDRTFQRSRQDTLALY